MVFIIVLVLVVLLVLAIPVFKILWGIFSVIKALEEPISCPQQSSVNSNRRRRSRYDDDWDDFYDDDWEYYYDDYWDDFYDDELYDMDFYDEYEPEPIPPIPVKKEKSFLEKKREQDFKEAWMFRESRYEVGDYCRICHKLIESGECEHYTPWWKINLGVK